MGIFLTFLFLDILFHYGFYRILGISPVLYHRTLLIHPTYDSLHLPAPLLVRPSLPLGTGKPVLCVCEPVSVLLIGPFVPYFRFHIEAIVHGICLSLSDLLLLVL